MGPLGGGPQNDHIWYSITAQECIDSKEPCALPLIYVALHSFMRKLNLTMYNLEVFI